MGFFSSPHDRATGIERDKSASMKGRATGRKSESRGSAKDRKAEREIAAFERQQAKKWWQ